jgi:hypothetical protein
MLGVIDYQKLGIAHRGKMAMMEKMISDKKSNEELKGAEKVFADIYGGKVDFTDRSAIAQLEEYARNFELQEERRGMDRISIIALGMPA